MIIKGYSEKKKKKVGENKFKSRKNYFAFDKYCLANVRPLSIFPFSSFLAFSTNFFS